MGGRVKGDKHDYKPEGKMGKRAHRLGKYAMWASAGWESMQVSMPTDQANTPCDGVTSG